MPDLKRSIRWQRYEPDLPGNRVTPESPKGHRPFFFELASDMTKEQLRGMKAGLEAIDALAEAAGPSDETPEARELRIAATDDAVLHQTAETLKPFIRLGAEPLTIDGETIASLEEYLRAVAKFGSTTYVAEPGAALARVNTLYGVQGFFSERLSGGFASTR